MAKKKAPNGARPAKAPAKKRAPAKPKAPSADSKTDGSAGAKHHGKPGRAVVVRMYRQGLGDCFLLSFPPGEGPKPVHVMIDCGVLQKTDREAEKLRAVVADIAQATGGKVDLLIVTHEHWDHIAGFSHARDIFQAGQLTFGRVWLSWLENLKDPLARTIYDDLSKKKKKVETALGLIAKSGLQARFKAAARDDQDPNARRMDEDIETSKSILAFLGMADPGTNAAAGKNPPAAAGPRMTLGETMDWLRSLVKPGDFCSPGERRALPGAAGVHVYVLGPPRDESLIKQMDATGEAGYAFQADRVSLLGAIDHLESGGDEPAPGPFEERYRFTPEQAAAAPFFRESYGFPDDPISDGGEAWRRIDDEWLVSGVSQLALQIDKRVNNSSFAVAFELPDGRTLVFPGDAQFGNWFSWDDLKFKDEAGKEVPTMTKQLLNRAILYKVGHHGSHNATRPAALHEMSSGELVAMIPTDEEFALQQNKKGSWRMPAEELAKDLQAFTARRILRADRTQEDLDKEGQEADAARQWEAFDKRVKFADAPLLPDLDAKKSPLYVQYTIPLE
jgi:hypothetical protein